MKYRIVWVKKGQMFRGDKIHRGELIFNDREDAEGWAKKLNGQYPTLHHGVETEGGDLLPTEAMLRESIEERRQGR